MLDHPISSSVVPDVLARDHGLRDRIGAALHDALHLNPSTAASDFAALVGDYVSLVFFMASSEHEAPDEAVLMGPEIGTAFISSDIVKARLGEKRMTLSFRTAFAPGGDEFKIEAARETSPTNRDLPPVITIFLAKLAEEFQARDILISRAAPMAIPHNEPPALPIDKYGDLPPTSRQVGRRWVIIAGGVALLAIANLFAWHFYAMRHHVSALAMAPISSVPGSAESTVVSGPFDPASSSIQAGEHVTANPASSAPGIGGVTIKVGGYGVGSGPKLEAFGIHPGAELAKTGE